MILELRKVKIKNIRSAMSKLSLKIKATAVVYTFSFLISLIFANKTTEIQSAARRLRLFPHIINQIPPQVIKVSYGKHKVDLGNTLKSEDIVKAPQISWPTEEDMLYTLALIGPDAKNLQDEKCSYEHWLVGNIPGTDIDEGEELSEYVGLLESAYDTGVPHRLIFWVYEQAYGERIPFDGARINKTDVGASREVLNFPRFVEYYELGRPIAINFCEVFLNKTKT